LFPEIMLDLNSRSNPIVAANVIKLLRRAIMHCAVAAIAAIKR
jgi:hypothetical protein